MVLHKAESPASHLLMWVPFPFGRLMCRCRSLHLPDVNADCFPIPSASHHSINGMLKLVQYSRTLGNGNDRGTSRGGERERKMPLGVSGCRKAGVGRGWTPPP